MLTVQCSTVYNYDNDELVEFVARPGWERRIGSAIAPRPALTFALYFFIARLFFFSALIASLNTHTTTHTINKVGHLKVRRSLHLQAKKHSTGRLQS